MLTRLRGKSQTHEHISADACFAFVVETFQIPHPCSHLKSDMRFYLISRFFGGVMRFGGSWPFKKKHSKMKIFIFIFFFFISSKCSPAVSEVRAIFSSFSDPNCVSIRSVLL